MKTIYTKGLGILLFIGALLFTFISFDRIEVEKPVIKKIRSTSSPHANREMKKPRDEYFFHMLRDPLTNNLPPLLRQKELAFAKKLRAKNSLNKTTAAVNWNEAGPFDVGGRTKAISIDVNNPNNIIVGSASGGIWKSTDNGATWKMKSLTSHVLSVTTIAQDPRAGFTNNWYYGGGEFQGSGNDLGFTARFGGDGIYKSSDNGETWQVLPGTASQNPVWDRDFDYVARIIVNPANGHIYVAVNGMGILRSANGGNSFESVLGGVNQHIHSDIAVDGNGNLLAVISAPFQGQTATNTPGVYKSSNGTNWTKVNVAGYQNSYERSVIAIAPSNPNTAYLLTQTGQSNNNKEVIKFFKIDVGAGTGVDRSNNLPDFSAESPNTGVFDSQRGYNMTLAVKPNDENFVLIGGTNLYRSTDGFATKPTTAKTAWIGGYYPSQGYSVYPNFHSDIHSYAFDPTNPNKIWFGHDGGLSYTSDITATNYAQVLPWENKNNSYNVTQFYHIAIPRSNGDYRIMGGTQDNGSPYFRYTGSAASSEDVSSGDGAISHFGQNFAYTSSQNGNLWRLGYDPQGNVNLFQNNVWSGITPKNATGQSFINPFVVDPNNEDIMYYVGGTQNGGLIWRNNQLTSIPNGENGTTVGWTSLDNLLVPNSTITALAISNSPANILYYAATDFQGKPKIFKLSNASTATTGAVDISIPAADNGTYVHNIAVNPDDANEIIVVISNYNVVGLFHSSNGGQTYSPIEGNLAGTQENMGPSMRAACILPAAQKTYFLATSIGLFSTTQLNGNNTTWALEGADKMGNVIVNYVTGRKSDGWVVAGTHGRGAFVGNAGGGGGNATLSVSTNQLTVGARPGETGSKQITISNSGSANLNFNITATGGPGLMKAPFISYPVSKSSWKTKTPAGFNSQKNESRSSTLLINKSAAVEELINDDGNALPDGFIGSALQGYYFYWASQFMLNKDFTLEKVRFYMKTETASSNSVGIEVQSSNGTTLYTTTVNTDLSASGKWYEFALPQQANLSFQNGQSFYIIIASLNTALTFPAGYDENGLKPGVSYWAYYDVSMGYFSGYVGLTGNAAFLVRAVGNSGGGGTNQNPAAVAQLSTTNAQVGQNINFNASASSDADGQITAYSWNFGDGQTSNQQITEHAYTQAGTFTYTLTVTDDKGATGQTQGQVTITGGGTNRFTVEPSSGTIAPGESRLVTITFDASGLPEGNHTAQLNITSNGGNQTIPVNIQISNVVGVEDNNNQELSFSLDQNYPNPFNPGTTIRWAIPEAGNVTLKIYDIEGSEVATLIDEFKAPGRYETKFDASRHGGLSSGVYFYRLTAANYTMSKKFVLLR